MANIEAGEADQLTVASIRIVTIAKFPSLPFHQPGEFLVQGHLPPSQRTAADSGSTFNSGRIGQGAGRQHSR